MKRYQIYGMGNALLDLEYDVTEERLRDLNIDKGLMTLINDEREAQLSAQLQALAPRHACGGSAGNTIVLARQLGADVFFSCKVADDAAGEQYYQDLLEHGVHTNLGSHGREPGRTGKCFALVTPDAQRSMSTYLGITQTFSQEQLYNKALIDSQWLYIEGYLVAQPSAQQAALQAASIAREHGVKIALTLSDPNMMQYFGDNMRAILAGGVDFIFANENEAQLFANSDQIDSMAACLAEHANEFIITRSERGATLYTQGRLHDVAAYPTQAVDSTGAGDVFAGAYLSAITRGLTHQQAADLASLAGSLVVGIYGPRLTHEHIHQLQQHVMQHLSD